MSEQRFATGGMLPRLVGRITNRTGRSERILTNAEWMRIWHAGRPREELKWRLNQRLKGNEPGRSVNWKGLR